MALPKVGESDKHSAADVLTDPTEEHSYLARGSSSVFARGALPPSDV